MLESHRKTISEVSNQIVDRYKKEKNVLGIFLIGSAAQGTFDEYSDIDFFIILAKRGKYQREKFSTATNIDVEILLNTPKEVKQFLDKEKASIYRNTSHMLANGRIIYQTSLIARQLQSFAQKNLKTKIKYSSDEVTMHKYSIVDFLEDARRDVAHKNFIAFNLDGNFLIQNATELLLKLSNNYSHKPKEMSTVLKRIDQRFVTLLKDFYKTQSSQNKFKKLENISEFVLKKSGGKLNKKWVLRSK